jgi:hypothetical protein
MSRWNREAALLGIPDLPEEAFKHVGDGKIKPQGGGGGGGQTTSTNYTSNVPEWARPQFETIMGRGLALSETPYQAYEGERVAQFTPLQQRAFQGAENQQVAGQVGLGSGLAAMSGLSSFTQPGTAGQFMSPFIMNALAPQLQEQARQSAIQGTQQQAEATQRGAFGGSRDAIMRAERERNLAQQQGDTLSRGLQSAFESGQGQFNQEQQQRLAAASALGQLGQTQFGQQMDITNLQGQMGGMQQDQIQRILDQQYADFQQQRDFPYQQLGFASDLLRGAGGTSRSIYSTPQTSPSQLLAGLGTAAAGLGRMAKGGQVKKYAVGGGIAGGLGDAQLAQTAQQPATPMMGLAAANEMAERAQLRQAAPAGIPGMGAQEPQADAALEVLVEELKRAVEQGDEPRAEVLRDVIAERLDPANTGIAAAAADTDMGAFAQGGIIGFNEGGETRSAALDEQRARDRERLAELGRLVGTGADRAGRAIADVATLPVRGVVGAYDTAVVRPLRAAGLDAAYLSPRLVPEGADVSSMTPFYDMVRTPRRQSEPVPEPAPVPATAAETGLAAVVAEPVTSEPERTTPADRMSLGLGASTSTGGREAGLAAVPSLNLSRLPGMNDMDALLQQIKDQAREASGADKEALEAEATDLEARIAARTPAQESRRARLEAEEQGLDGKRDRAKNMALVEAGLAILSADPSRGAFSAIGTGALQGLRTYKGDVAQLEERRQAIFEKMDEIEELRRQEAMADDDKRAEIRGRIRGLRGAAIREQMGLMRDVGIPIKNAQNKMVFDAAMQERDLQSRQAIAQLQAQTARDTASMRLESGGGNDPAQRDADRAFANNPEVKMLLQQAQSITAQLDPMASQRIQRRLTEIQNDIYRQYGLTMQTPTAGAGMSGFRVLGVE